MRGTGSASAAAAAALLITLLASTSAAQDESRQRAPRIRVYSQSGPISSSYVTPAIEVSEDAYVFAVSLDLDGQIQILHPEFPGISVRMLKNRELRLPNFFAGFAHGGGTYDASGRYVSYSDYYTGNDDSRGTVIALASRVPFSLERVESGGDWNIATMRRLIEHRDPASAAHALAVYLGAKGEPIGTGYMRFASAQYHQDYASSPLYACDLYYGGYGPGLALSRLAVLSHVATMRRSGRSVSIIGYDFCGMPIVVYGPSQLNTKPRVPARAAAIGTFPITPRVNPPQVGEVMILAPRQSRQPREIFNEPHNDGALNGASVEGNRTPVEPSVPRAQTPVIGTLQPREYPRPVIREAPQPRSEPARAPDRSPPPPPPRTQSATRSRPTADPVPPPGH